MTIEGETIEALPSEDNGNVPVDVAEVAPSVTAETKESTETVVPTEKVTEQPTEPVVELYELPDGRKVDASTLTKEWKENFLPDYTRKSQELAKVKQPETQLPENKPTNPIDDPNWIPSSYAEVVKVTRDAIKAEQEAEQNERIERQNALENTVIAQLNEVKTLDPNVNESALFLHATKYGFNNLKFAHQNMKDMAEQAKVVQQTTVKNIAKRADPVSTASGGNASLGINLNPSDFETASDYLKALKGQG